ncbi:hypothetical protein TraAM80_03232 [Trypanosoma rangeli]|uniref:Uncharacterized protein n=1 Tax=Trypanosoma rangeli TaxID=5698 RepID=A0A3R7KJC8_TRYRA|nr:uncharacterized protein TraAM80_03232 [Trypanosoma rangeli]RNF07635.1 hypothetical protein TraAM80_03232 [Trypanosoma rangeli]|eukprot:RNF07635.1 hypothetical protein TraAM80_03232 [Trypanosoma rangeli]
MRDRRAELRFHPAMLATLVVLVMVAFALGYRHGVTTWEKDFVANYEKSRGHERHVADMLQICGNEIFALSANVSSNNGTLDDVQNENAGIEEEMRKLSQEFKVATDAVDKCQAEIAIISEGEAKQGGVPNVEVTAAENELRRLSELLGNLTEGEGMHRVHIHRSLASIRKVYKLLCGNFPGCTVLSDEFLLLRWKEDLHNSLQRWMLMEAERMQRMGWRYNKEDPGDKGAIYFAEGEERKTLTFFGRTGRPALLFGQDKELQVVVATALERVLLLQQFAFCAYRNNNPNITFPSIFQWSVSSESTTAALHDLVETPLVIFCMDCAEVKNTSEFVRSCLQDSGGNNGYGERDYWAVRSMLLPHPGVVQDAKNFYTAHTLTARKVLAVLAHNPVEDCLALLGEPRGNHFLYLVANFPEERKRFESHVSNNTLHQCSPTAAQLVQRITQVIEEEKLSDATPGFDTIYVSASSEMRKELKRLEKKPAWWSMTLFRQDEVSSAHEELVELTVVSRAGALLVSPFLASSRYVVESFLLSHGLQPMSRVWFF